MGQTISQAPSCELIPYLAYRDAGKAIDFLCRAFGFEERSRHPMPDGRVGHAELGADGQTIYLSSAYPELGIESPLDLAGVHGQIYLTVPDVNAHYERARDGGATIAAEPTDQEYGRRMYRAVDPEGHRWMIAGPVSTEA